MKNILKIVVLLMSISTFSQGPWTKEKGKFYTQLSFTTIPSYDELFGDPDYNLERSITDNTFQFYGEYGLTAKTTIIVNLPLKNIEIGSLVDSNVFSGTIPGSETALGNIEFGLKHQFYNKNWVLAGQISIETNTNSYNNNTGIRTGYDAATITPLFLAGKSFGKSYLQTNIGFQIRTNDYSSNFKFGGEYGSKIFKNFWLVGFLDVVKSFENGTIDLPFVNEQTGLYVNDQEYGVVGVKAIGEFSDNFGITASLPAAFFGNNVAKQVALSIGIYKKF